MAFIPLVFSPMAFSPSGIFTDGILNTDFLPMYNFYPWKWEMGYVHPFPPVSAA